MKRSLWRQCGGCLLPWRPNAATHLGSFLQRRARLENEPLANDLW